MPAKKSKPSKSAAKPSQSVEVAAHAARSGKKSVAMLVGGGWHPFEACGKIAKSFLDSTGRYEVTVTGDQAILAGGLSKYDALIIYAQGWQITPEQEKGLLAFVRGGGALVGIHCATDVFRNSKEYIRLIGGQFKTHPHQHGFTVNIVDTQHQATTRLSDFTIFEEMYHLSDVAEDVHVLATTAWECRPIPMMYTRTEGDGRVFYTALGHAEKQFKHPKFQRSLLHGLDWACKVEPKAGPIRCAMLGYGPAFKMGKQHSTFINNTPGMQAVAACDVNPMALKQAKEDFPHFKLYDDCDMMLKDDQIDLVVIILPHNLHAAMALKCLNAGKHVVLEKPFCLTVEEADAMIAAAEKNGKMLTVYHNRRWDGDYLTIKGLIQDGRIGKVFQIQAGFNGYSKQRAWWRSEKAVSGGNLYDWGAHFVDWVLGLLPGRKIAGINGFFQNYWGSYTNEDHTQAIVRFDDGTMADVSISNLSAAGRPRWRILGATGAILDDGTVDKGCKMMTWENEQLVTHEIKWQAGEHQEYYWNLADHLLCGDELIVKPQQARRTIGIIEYAERSSKSGKTELLPGE